MSTKPNKHTLQLTARGRYAVNVMVELAKQQEMKPAPLSGIAERSQISLSYLEQLISGLRKHGLVKSYRGPGGGYVLKKPANDIVISEILIAAEDITPAKRNKAKKPVADESASLWDHIGEFLYTKLKTLTLADVLKEKL